MNVKELSTELNYAIDQASVELFPDEDRWHLGASQIGHSCSRYLYYIFRWIGKDAATSPRMRRLFNRGHHEEIRFNKLITQIGFKLILPSGGEDQHRISDCDGHFGGSLDGIAETSNIDSNKYPKLAKNLPPVVTLEYKTSGTGKGYTDYQKTVILHKPIYYAQACTYGYKTNIPVECFFVVNKNDDDIISEVIELDLDFGKANIAKAESIIFAEKLPERLSQSPSFSTCKYCDFKNICHFEGKAVVNCRSCRYSKPSKDAQWMCSKFNSFIPKDFIYKGCQHWESVV